MTFLPIVAREMRLAARRGRTYRVRLINAVLASIIGGYLLYWFNHTGLGLRIGPSVLSIFLFPILYMAFFAGLAAADSVSQEKRDGTLGLLFLTDLKGYDVILGKLCASGFTSFYGLLAMMPIAAFSLILGGVTGGEVFRACLVLLNALFFSHAAAMIVSAFSVKAQRAVSGATLLVLLFVMIFPALASLLEHYHHFGLARILTTLSPITAVQHLPNPGFRPKEFWYPLLGSHLCSWAFLAVACWHVPRSWQDNAGSIRLRWRERLRQWTYGDLPIRTAFRQRLLTVNPFHWLLNRARFKPMLIWGAMATIIAGALFITYEIQLHEYRYDQRIDWVEYLSVFVGAQITLHALLRVWLASEACWCLEEQRRNGGLELLLCCSPLTPPELLRGCWQSLRRLFSWPLVFVLGADAALFFLVLLHWHDHNKKELLAGILAAMIMLVADAMALGWVGLWTGLSSKRPRQASTKAIRQILVVPWVIFGLIMMIAERLHVLDYVGFWTLFLLWFGLSMGTDWIFARLARRNLLTQFRDLITPGYEEPIGFFGRIGRWLGKMTAPRS